MLAKRIVVCLDVRNGKTTKGVKLRDNADIGDPVEMGESYYREGVDELVYYDITASAEKRSVFLDVVEKVAERIFIPFTVGGGISSIGGIRDVILSGAEKVSLNTHAVLNPSLIEEGAGLYGRQCIVLGMDAKRDARMPSGYRVYINGGRTPTELDALAWALRAEALGAGEIVLNSIDADGTRQGYDCPLTRLISTSVSVPVVASGGAGTAAHVHQVLTEGAADAALLASIVHYGIVSIREVKAVLASKGVAVRMGL